MNTPLKIRDGEHYNALTETPPPAMQPPAYGGPQQDAINSVFDGVVQDLFRKIGTLRETLDEIEQLVLTGAARAKAALQEQVDLCVKVDDEINHAKKVIADLRAQAAGQAAER
jgi:hypothetical protein